MERLHQEYVLSILFKNCIEKEELLQRKYDEYRSSSKQKPELEDMFRQYMKVSQEHIENMKDKMIKLNIRI